MKDKFELKKDICTPDYYIRAGIKKTKKQWQKLFPDAFTFKSNEWFIDLSVKEKANVGIVVNDIVDGVFKKKGLHSITYKDAAVESIRIYAKIHNTLHQQALKEEREGLKPKHKCKPIAEASMGQDRHLWVGELTEPIKEYPQEKYCLHIKTPVKDIVFLCNRGDFEQLYILAKVIGINPDKHWTGTMIRIAKNKVK